MIGLVGAGELERCESEVHGPMLSVRLLGSVTVISA